MMIGLTLLGGDKPRRVQDSAGEWHVTQVNKFLDAENLVLLAKDASFIAIMAVGMTAIIVMGGIDLSVGSIYALAALIGGIFLRYNWSQGPPGVTLGGSALGPWGLVAVAIALGVGARVLARAGSGRGALAFRAGSATMTALGGAALLWALGLVVVALRDAQGSAPELPLWKSLLVGIGACCAIGGLCGLINGALIVGLNVHPFIITLGTMAVLRGVSFVLTKGLPVSGFPDSFTTGFFKKEIAGVYPVPVMIMVAIAALGAFVLGRTVLGRRTYAIGGNETAARYAGVPVGRVKIVMFTLMGMLAGLSAAVYLGYLGAASSDAGQGYELSVIAAAVIGGASLSGGRGSALGAVLGAVLIQLINNAMIILDIDTNYTNIVMGAAIVVAVVMDQAKSRLLPGAH
jgi:ribose/xylose/arabinose/galactoside ABC-type transport system permease subunit